MECSHGFATYKFRDNDCYIIDIYVEPEKRKLGVAAEMANQIAAIAKQKGYKILTGSVDSRAHGAESSAAVLKSYGMSPYKKEDHVTYYFKGI